MQLRWYLARLQRMSLREVAWRSRQTFLTQIEAITSGTSALPSLATTVRKELSPLTQQWPVSYFSATFDWKGEDIPWQGSPHNIQLTSLHWSKINYRDTATFGDPKTIWELNRHQFLRQWISGNPQLPNAISHLILHWIEKNPYGHGMNWCSSLELALRLVSWESCLAATGEKNFEPRVLEIIRASVVEHCRHLRRHPSLYSSANNHRVGELLGEIAAAVICPADTSLSSSAARAWDAMQTEARRQVTTDGICREQAFFYHAYTMLYFKRAASYAERLSLLVPTWFTELTHKMHDALSAATDNNGDWFEIGDRDDGDLRALLPYDEESQSQPISVPAEPGFHYCSEGGYTIWKTPMLHMLFRCGEFGYPSIAAHAHCDQLSVLLKMNNREILTDSGTGSYHDNEFWRRYFRGTTAHNTVRVNGEDQADYGGPFLWNTSPAGIITEAHTEKVIGHTRAWCRGPHPVVHQRTIEFHPDAVDMLRVYDELMPEIDPDTTRDYELIWNFGPGILLTPGNTLDEEADCFRLTVQLNEISIMEMKINVSARSKCVLYHGNETIPAGFFSRQFGQRIPITQLRIVCRAAAWQATTLFFRIENQS